jgi:enoyl-CoA hydratase / 3-hydroxyacyl-CoA dehydrogenase
MSGINKIGVIGAGNMGSGIAQKIAQEGINVVLVDTKDEYIKKGLSSIGKLLQEAVHRKVLSQEQMDNTLARINATCDLYAVADTDIVIEAIFEDKNAKFELFERLDRICSKDTIIATNTSNLYVNDFASKTSRPDRFIGMHYFYHPAKNKLVEIIPGAGTSKATIDKSILAARLHGKTPVMAKDTPGFSVNRYFVPSLNEAARLLEQGVANMATIEEAYKRAFGVGMGAFELMNVTGVPLASHGNATLGGELGSFYMPCEILKRQAEKNEPWRIEGAVDESRIQTVTDRLYGLCLGIAATMVDDGIASMEDIDLGARTGLRWSKGPFEIMISIGMENAYRVVRGIAEKYPDFRMPRMFRDEKELDYLIALKTKRDQAKLN